MAKAIIIRGVPGSGKSTLAKTLYPHAKHFEADMYFMRDGEYKWNGAELEHAHRWCFIQFRDALAAGHDVVVSNVFARNVEMEWYLTEAQSKGHEIIIHEAKGNYQNVHGVSDEKMELIRKKFEPLQASWKLFWWKPNHVGTCPKCLSTVVVGGCQLEGCALV